MPAPPIRLIFAAVAVLALGLVDADGCGYVPDELKGEGEPCTRSSECEAGLTCRGGVCMPEPPPDGGTRDLDAGGDEDAGAASDGGAIDDAGALDDGGPIDEDAAAPDAAPADAAIPDGASG